jgi:polar amino acid transport system substrate-binding protein
MRPATSLVSRATTTAALFITLFVTPFVTACDLPRDPEGTLERVRGGVLRVGAIDEAPWVVHDAHRDAHGQPRGVEVALVEALADRLGAEVRWDHGGETRLLAALERFELDLVIGGLDADSPYADEVGFTRPYYEADGHAHVLAAPPGENAWLMTIEGFLRGQQLALPGLIAREAAAQVAASQLVGATEAST